MKTLTAPVVNASIPSLNLRDIETITLELLHIQSHVDNLCPDKEKLLKDKILMLPEYLHVSDFNAVFNLIKDARNKIKHQEAIASMTLKGENQGDFPVSKGRKGKPVRSEVVQAILHLLKHSDLTLKEIAMKTNVSVGTIHHIKFLAGLVRARKPKVTV